MGNSTEAANRFHSFRVGFVDGTKAVMPSGELTSSRFAEDYQKGLDAGRLARRVNLTGYATIVGYDLRGSILREVDPIPNETVNDPITALRLLIVATKRYCDSENAVAVAMGEEAFRDDGSNPEFTAALEEQSEAVRVLREALEMAGRVARGEGGGR